MAWCVIARVRKNPVGMACWLPAARHGRTPAKKKVYLGSSSEAHPILISHWPIRTRKISGSFKLWHSVDWSLPQSGDEVPERTLWGGEICAGCRAGKYG